MNVTPAIPSRTVFHFLNARAVYDPARTTLLSELYDEYREWCLDHAWQPTVCRWFSRYLREHASNRGASLDLALASGRLPCYVGVALKRAEPEAIE
jgi:hypothetical protein